MNIKLHTPKSLKSGSGMSSIKQFLLSLFATTVSIVLTFGTAAIIDGHKKKAAKKEMVMMVISDMDKTIELIQDADSALREAKSLQMELATDPDLYDSLHVCFPPLFIFLEEEFPETIEKIFTTSIEPFNTISDVNFVNEVSSFYLQRRKYKETVLDSLKMYIQANPFRHSMESLLEISFPDYVCDNWVYLDDLKYSRDRCMQMMGVSEKDMLKFNKEQLIIDEYDLEDGVSAIKIFNECESCNNVIEQARMKLKK